MTFEEIYNLVGPADGADCWTENEKQSLESARFADADDLIASMSLDPMAWTAAEKRNINHAIERSQNP